MLLALFSQDPYIPSGEVYNTGDMGFLTRMKRIEESMRVLSPREAHLIPCERSNLRQVTEYYVSYTY